MRIILLLLCTIALCGATIPAAAVDDWVGLWSLEHQSEDRDARARFLWVSKNARIRLYDARWNRLNLTRESKINGPEAHFIEIYHGGQLDVQAERTGDRMSGRWRFLHPQFRQEGVLAGHRVSGARLSDWTPIAGANANTSADRVLNLSRTLSAKAAAPDQFESYWKDSFLADFFPFGKDAPAASTMLKELSKPSHNKEAQLIEEVVGEIQKSLARQDVSGVLQMEFVLRPFGAETEQIVIEKKPFLAINPVLMTQGLKESRKTITLAQKLLEAQTRPFMAHRKDLSGRIFSQGFNLHLLGVVFPERRNEVMGLRQKRWDALIEEIPQMKRKLATAKRLKSDEMRVLSLDFMTDLANRYPESGILKMTPIQVNDALARYLAPPRKDEKEKSGDTGS